MTDSILVLSYACRNWVISDFLFLCECISQASRGRKTKANFLNTSALLLFFLYLTSIAMNAQNTLSRTTILDLIDMSKFSRFTNRAFDQFFRCATPQSVIIFVGIQHAITESNKIVRQCPQCAIWVNLATKEVFMKKLSPCVLTLRTFKSTGYLNLSSFTIIFAWFSTKYLVFEFQQVIAFLVSIAKNMTLVFSSNSCIKLCPNFPRFPIFCWKKIYIFLIRFKKMSKVLNLPQTEIELILGFEITFRFEVFACWLRIQSY